VPDLRQASITVPVHMPSSIRRQIFILGERTMGHGPASIVSMSANGSRAMTTVTIMTAAVSVLVACVSLLVASRVHALQGDISRDARLAQHPVVKLQPVRDVVSPAAKRCIAELVLAWEHGASFNVGRYAPVCAAPGL
jgi:hypothetical protein